MTGWWGIVVMLLVSLRWGIRSRSRADEIMDAFAEWKLEQDIIEDRRARGGSE